MSQGHGLRLVRAWVVRSSTRPRVKDGVSRVLCRLHVLCVVCFPAYHNTLPACVVRVGDSRPQGGVWVSGGRPLR